MTRRHFVPGAGPIVISRWRHGARTVLTRQPRRGGEGMVRTRRHGVRGHTTTGGRHDGASDSLPGGARCSRMVLHLPLPTYRVISTGVGERQRGVFTWIDRMDRMEGDGPTPGPLPKGKGNPPPRRHCGGAGCPAGSSRMVEGGEGMWCLRCQRFPPDDKSPRVLSPATE